MGHRETLWVLQELVKWCIRHRKTERINNILRTHPAKVLLSSTAVEWDSLISHISSQQGVQLRGTTQVDVEFSRKARWSLEQCRAPNTSTTYSSNCSNSSSLNSKSGRDRSKSSQDLSSRNRCRSNFYTSKSKLLFRITSRTFQILILLINRQKINKLWKHRAKTGRMNKIHKARTKKSTMTTQGLTLLFVKSHKEVDSHQPRRKLQLRLQLQSSRGCQSLVPFTRTLIRSGWLGHSKRVTLVVRRLYSTWTRPSCTHSSNLWKMLTLFFRLRSKDRYVRYTSWWGQEYLGSWREWLGTTSWWCSQQVCQNTPSPLLPN